MQNAKMQTGRKNAIELRPAVAKYKGDVPIIATKRTNSLHD
jgi:hypothetical protein